MLLIPTLSVFSNVDLSFPTHTHRTCFSGAVDVLDTRCVLARLPDPARCLLHLAALGGFAGVSLPVEHVVGHARRLRD